VQILSALCDALEYAHTFTVHRDISPENVMLLKDGKLKLLDFGIAKVMDTSAHTTASVSMGKAYYAAPEQRKDASRVDQRADIFSLGVLFFEMLTGELPVGYNRITEIMPLLPAKCDEVISRTLAPVERRYRNVAEFRQAIAACVKAAAGPQALARDDAREMAPVRQPSEPPEAPAVALDDPWPFKSVPASGEVTPKVSLRLPRLPRWLTVRRAVVLGCLIPIGLIVAGVAASQISFRTAQREAAQLRSQITDDHREHAAQEVGAAEKAWDAAQGAGWHFSEAKAQYAKAAEEYGKAVRATDARIKLSGVKADAAQARDDLDKLKKTASAETWQLANTDAEAGETAWKTGLAAEQWPLSALTHFEGALRSFNAAIQKLAAAPAEENPEAATKKTASSSRAERKARLAGWVKADVEVSPDKLDADGLYKVSRRTPLIVAPDGQSIEQAINNDQDTRQLPPDGMFRVNSSIRAAKNKWYKVLISEDGGANYYWLNSADLAGQDLEMAYEPKVAAPEQPAGALEPQRGRERIDSAPTTPYVPRYRKQANQPYGVQATPVMPTQVNWLSP
jgi:hypothetical protein